MYKQEQKDIAQTRKKKGFKTKEDDIKTQQDSWENFMFKRFEITGEEKHRLEIFDYFKQKTSSEYVSFRDSYYKKEIEVDEYESRRENIFDRFEEKMVQYGVLKKKPENSIRKKYLKDNRDNEKAVMKGKAYDNKKSIIELCKIQKPIAEKYYEEISIRN